MQAVRNGCTDKVMPKMMELYNKQVIKVGGTWMTWYEEMRALGTINGRDVDANQQK